MKPVHVDVRIDAPAPRVWEVCSDIEHAADTIPDIERIEFLNELRQGVGMRWREPRRMSGREVTEVLEIVEWNAPIPTWWRRATMATSSAPRCGSCR